MTLKATTLSCYIASSNSANIKAPLQRHLIITMGSKYQGFIFLSAKSSMAKFFTSTKLSSFKSNSFILY